MVNTKGAPNKVEHFIQSTKRSYSLWEHVDAHDQDIHFSQLKQACSNQHPTWSSKYPS